MERVMSLFTFEQKMYCAKREVALRRQVYPGQVRLGRMEPDEAKQEIAKMQEIAEDYQRAVDRQKAKATEAERQASKA
jgi:hypothetical protein